MDFPEIEEGAKPRHRFMSAYEQKREPWDKRYQYLLIAAEPYEVIAFKVPNADVDKRQGDGDGRGGDEGVGGRGSGFIAHWEPDEKTYTLQICFKNDAATRERARGGGATRPRRERASRRRRRRRARYRTRGGEDERHER